MDDIKSRSCVLMAKQVANEKKVIKQKRLNKSSAKEVNNSTLNATKKVTKLIKKRQKQQQKQQKTLLKIINSNINAAPAKEKNNVDLNKSKKRPYPLLVYEINII